MRQKQRQPEASTNAERHRRQKAAEGRKANSRQGGKNDKETAEQGRKQATAELTSGAVQSGGRSGGRETAGREEERRGETGRSEGRRKEDKSRERGTRGDDKGKQMFLFGQPAKLISPGMITK